MLSRRVTTLLTRQVAPRSGMLTRTMATAEPRGPAQEVRDAIGKLQDMGVPYAAHTSMSNKDAAGKETGCPALKDDEILLVRE